MSKKILSLIAIAATLNAAAQNDTASGKPLDDVTVVTANKLAQKQSTTGKVITVIGKEILDRSQGKTVAQILNEQAGVTVNGAFNNAGSVQTLYMRGANAGRTLILMDGIPMNDPSTITTDYDLNLFSINDIERIEICKGAQSTLYGSDAIAGVINIITVKKDIQKAINVKATTSFGSKNTTRNNIQVFGKAKKLTYTTRFAQLKTDGFSSAYDSTGNKNFDNDGYKGNIANVALQYDANKNLLLKTYVQHSSYKTDIDAGVFADKRNYFIDNAVLNAGAGFIYKKNALNIVGNYQHSKSKRHYDDGYATRTTGYSYNDYHGFSNYYELYASYKINEHFTVLAGNDYRFADMDGDYYYSSFSFGDKYKDTSMNQYSVYASVIYNALNKKMNIELGGRLNKHSRYGENNTFTFNPSYKISEQLRFFASIASGFKSPSIYQLYDAFSGNQQLNAEKSTTYEGGIQYNKKNWNWRIVYFNRETENGIDYNYISSKYFNYIKQTVSGLELETAIQPTTALTITANYTLLSPKETTQNRVSLKDTLTYNYLLRRPKNSANITISYQFTKDLGLSVNGKYVDNRFDVGGYKKADVELKSYFLVNVNAYYNLNKNVNFFADLQNVGNTKFFDIRGYNAIPLMANVGVNFSW